MKENYSCGIVLECHGRAGHLARNESMARILGWKGVFSQLIKKEPHYRGSKCFGTYCKQFNRSSNCCSSFRRLPL